jgi:hypothetical protein
VKPLTSSWRRPDRFTLPIVLLGFPALLLVERWRRKHGSTVPAKES